MTRWDPCVTAFNASTMTHRCGYCSRICRQFIITLPSPLQMRMLAALLEMFHHLAYLVRPVLVRDEQNVVCVHDYQVIHANRYHHTVTDDQRAVGINLDVPVGAAASRVAVFVMGQHFKQG